jgi:DnaJ-class molecular chaperone
MNGMPFFQMFHDGAGANMHFQQQMMKPMPIIHKLAITLEQAYTGISTPIEIERWVMQPGNVKITEKVTYYVEVPVGIDNNEILIVRDKGNVLENGVVGDLKIFMEVLPHGTFERQGLDLILRREITLKESLCGFNMEFKYINGKTIMTKNNPGSIIQPGYRKVFQGMGMKRDAHVGNLVLELSVRFPEALTQDQIDKLQQVL